MDQQLFKKHLCNQSSCYAGMNPEKIAFSFSLTLGREKKGSGTVSRNSIKYECFKILDGNISG